MRSVRLRVAILALGLSLGVAAVVCAGAGANSRSGLARAASKGVMLNLGTSKVTVHGQPKIGIFIAASSAITYGQALLNGFAEASKQTHVPYTVYQGNFNTATQYSQIQNAIQSGRYSRIIVQPISSQACKVTKTAFAKHIVVVVLEAALCGEDAKSGIGVWTPGTLAYVGSATYDNYVQYWKSILQNVPGAHNVLTVTGPQGSGTVDAWNGAMKTALSGQSKVKVDDEVYTDYTAPSAYTQIQNYLQGHKNIDTIVSSYFEDSVGAIKAIDQLGLQKKIKVYETGGGSTISKQEIENGSLVQTASPLPKTLAYASFMTMVNAYKGKKVGHLVVDAGLPLSQWNALQWVTKKTVAKFSPQY